MGRPRRPAVLSGHCRAFASGCAFLSLAVGPGIELARADSNSLEEVIVLAQKRPEKLGQVPMALSPSVDLELAGENLLDETVVYFDSVLNFINGASYQSFLALPRRYSFTLRARL